MKVIWKYEIQARPKFQIEMPLGAKILTLQLQQGEPMLWVLVNPKANRIARLFRVFETGITFDEKLEYVGTFQLTPASPLAGWDDILGGQIIDAGESRVFHVFEEI